jgi:HD superfamily phosphohydrolase YqeK
MAQQIDVTKNKQRFCDILLATKRENINYVIEDLDELGFFEAPASVKNHYNFAGGLVEHSLKVYEMAMALRESIIKMRPDMEAQLPVDSIAIATLLHDVCKADIYRTVQRARKNEIGIYEKYEEYSVDYSNFPVGHGEKSVIMLLRSGLDLEDAEIFAIRWHMGAWELAQQSIEQERSYRTAQQRSPLVALVHTADTLSAQILERDA